jgi:hypothetical protein
VLYSKLSTSEGFPRVIRERGNRVIFKMGTRGKNQKSHGKQGNIKYVGAAMLVVPV